MIVVVTASCIGKEASTATITQRQKNIRQKGMVSEMGNSEFGTAISMLQGRRVWEGDVLFYNNKRVEAVLKSNVFHVADPATGQTVLPLHHLLSWEEVIVSEPEHPTTVVEECLIDAANTYAERNAVYKDNLDMVGKVMTILFPDGVTLMTHDEHIRFHTFSLLIMKLTRYAVSGLTHKDSIHDSIVYCAIIQSLTNDNKLCGGDK